MKKLFSAGPMLYYATDKNLFDALSSHRVDSKLVAELFHRRNTLVSKKTNRDALARQFSSLAHDYADHQQIAHKLGVIQRRERLTPIKLITDISIDELLAAIGDVRQVLEEGGDVIVVERTKKVVRVRVQYQTIDFTRTQLGQLQTRDGEIEFALEGGEYMVRANDNERISAIRDSIISAAISSTEKGVVQQDASLFDVPDGVLRSKFFDELSKSLVGYSRFDVKEAYVFKPRPDGGDEDADTLIQKDPHVEKISLRGDGVNKTDILGGLSSQDYYIFRMGWLAQESKEPGNVYEIDAQFSDPLDCAQFSFLVGGVYPCEDSVVSSRRRPPLPSEVGSIASAVEKRAIELAANFRRSLTGGQNADED